MFEILGEISQIETIATASGIREIARLRKMHGSGDRPHSADRWLYASG